MADDRRQGDTRRVASSVWWPVGTGALLLMLLATAALIAGGRVERGVRVPNAFVDMQQSATTTAAQSVRRSMNEAVTDVAVIARTLSREGVTDPEVLRQHLSALAELHDRYSALYIVDQSRAVVAHVGENAHQNVLPGGESETGMTDAVDVEGSEVILLHSPLSGPAGASWTLVGEYDPLYLQYALEGTVPASSWVVNADGRVVGSTAGFAPLQRLDRQVLRGAAAAASGDAGYTVGGDIEAREVVTWAPAVGSGPAGSLGWGIVTARSLETVVLPETQARDQAILFGMLLLVITVGVGGWLYAMLMRPLRRLQYEAERLSYGDLRYPVEVRRYDEIGLIGRSLERVRLILVRRRVQDSVVDAGDRERV